MPTNTQIVSDFKPASYDADSAGNGGGLVHVWE